VPAYKGRSGAGAEKTKFTDGTSMKVLRSDGKEAKYNTGGSS
jgi:L-ascorbate peroxidase